MTPAADQTGTDGTAPVPPVAPAPGIAAAICHKRIVTTTVDARVLRLDAETGVLCPDFGDGGYVDLLKCLGPTAEGSYYLTSAPLVAEGIVMIGGKLNDNLTVGEASGVRL